MKLKQLREIISELIEGDNAPVVVYAAVWPFMRMLNLQGENISETILTLLFNLIVDKKRILMMPSFTGGYKNGVCNLDLEPSSTGALSEFFRKMPDVKRTLSAFFSFAVFDDDTALSHEILNLKPTNAWGEGSVYHWMEEKNVHFLMLGVHPTHCSYLHRMEWLAKDKIIYRHDKSFQGTIIRENTKINMSEILYVRAPKPEAINDFTTILPVLKNNGMKQNFIDGVSISHMRAIDMKNAFLPLLNEDPLTVIKNRNDFACSNQASSTSAG